MLEKNGVVIIPAMGAVKRASFVSSKGRGRVKEIQRGGEPNSLSVTWYQADMLAICHCLKKILFASSYQPAFSPFT